MFFEGTLQSGISLAIQQQKLVACFVRQDDDETSHKWENEWLNAVSDAHDDDQNSSAKSLGDRLSDRAVFLRIDAGTQEAGFLGAFCSLSSVPKLLIIRQGSVLEDIDASVSQEQFTERISSHLRPQQVQEQQQPRQPTLSADTNSAAADLGQVLSNVPLVGEQRTLLRESDSPAPAETSETNVPLSAPARQANVQTLLEERGVRLEAERKKREEAEKEARKAIARQRKEAADRDAAASSSVPAKKQDWADQQRNRQREARLERERILKTIESDKLARKQREEQRRLLSQGETSAVAAAQRPVQPDTARARAGPICALQIRLFDGTSLRTRFDSSATLATSVRTYISQNSQTDTPYEFRQMLTPQPSKNISVGEENESLQSLGLTPSATLVLVPVKGYTDAYAGGGGLVSKGFHAGYGLLSGAASLVGSAVGGVIGYGGATNARGPQVAGAADGQEASNVQGSRAAGINIRTLGDQRSEANEGTELYNGNQLNFEARKKKDGQGDAKEE